MKKISVLVILVLAVTFGMFGQETFGLSGNVGIGTSTPLAASELDVRGLLHVDGGTAGTGDVVWFGGNYSDPGNYGLLLRKTYRLEQGFHAYGWNFFVSNTGNFQGDVLSLNWNGQVGIGTTDPWSKLHVEGGLRLSDTGVNGNVFTFHGTAKAGPSARSEWESSLKLDKVQVSHAGDSVPGYSWQYNLYNLGAYTGNAMTFYYNGNVGIGTTTPEYKLSVQGTIAGTAVRATNIALGDEQNEGSLTVNGEVITDSIIVKTDNYADFVFEDDYDLPSLEEVESFIDQNGHLPEIPSEAEAFEKGINVADMNVKLLQKVEELTLYLIEQNKQLNQQAEELAVLKAQLAE